MPVVSQLAAGTIVLENGENAVTEDQAAQLLPLWQAYTSLVESGGTAQAELDGLLAQVERGMTEAQINEIAALGLTEDKFQEMVDAGEIQLGRGGPGRGQNRDGGEDGAPAEGGGGRGGQGGGQGGGLGGGGRGQGGGGLGNLSPDEIATRQAERIEAAGGAEAFRAAQVSGAVVRLLNVKVNGEPVRQGNNDAFRIANETVATALEMTTEELSAALGEDGKTVQGVIEEMGGDLAAITASLNQALAESGVGQNGNICLLYTSPSPRDGLLSRMPSSA